MRYISIPCEACGKPFTETDDVVVCPVCGAPQHRACWIAAGACARQADHAAGFSWVSPVQPEPPQRRAEPEARDGRIVCPQCGGESFDNEIYCMRCGAKLRPDPADRYYPGEDPARDNAHKQEMIDAFNRFGGLDPNSMVDGIPVCEYADFVGGSAPGRIIRKVSIAERFGRSVSWILPAFLFGPVWYFYRKMKKEGLLISLVVILLAATMGLLQINDAFVTYVKGAADAAVSMAEGGFTPEAFRDTLAELTETYASTVLTGADAVKMQIASVLQYVLLVGCPLACSLLALRRYRKKVRASVFDIRGRCSDMQTYRSTLLREGGTSVGLAILGVVLLLFALFLMNYLPVLIALLR